MVICDMVHTIASQKKKTLYYYITFNNMLLVFFSPFLKYDLHNMFVLYLLERYMGKQMTDGFFEYISYNNEKKITIL